MIIFIPIEDIAFIAIVGKVEVVYLPILRIIYLF